VGTPTQLAIARAGPFGAHEQRSPRSENIHGPCQSTHVRHATPDRDGIEGTDHRAEHRRAEQLLLGEEVQFADRRGADEQRVPVRAMVRGHDETAFGRHLFESDVWIAELE